MTREELANYDGRDGRKAYFAVNGKIYDVSSSRMWVEGDHQGAHQAGADLTEELKSAPHVRTVIESFPVVGTLEEATVPTAKSGRWVVIAGGIAAMAAVVALLLK